MLSPKSQGKFRYVVVGAGVFGVWTAYELIRAGHRVLLVDQYGPANERSSSGGETRIIRSGYGPDEIYTRMAARSLPRWEELFAQTGRPLLLKTGVLWLSRKGDRYSAETQRSMADAGLVCHELSISELERRFPQIRFAAGMFGLWEPEAGALLARQAVRLVASEFVRLGGEYKQAKVEITLNGGVRTADRPLDADGFVFACGAWMADLVPALLPTRQEVFFFGTPAGDERFAPPALPVWIDFSDERQFYGFPDIEGRGFKLATHAHGTEIDPDAGSRLATSEGEAHARQYLTERFPALRDAPLVGSRVCVYENTPDSDLVIDQHPRFENVWIVGGGSGHGFKHGPAVGEYAAARVMGLSVPEVEGRFAYPSAKL